MPTQPPTKWVPGALSPGTSAILAEAYIQSIEHTQKYNILKTHKIIAYFRYVDDILIIYDNKNTNIDQTLNDFNNIQPTLKFTIEKEKHKILNFLDLTIHRKRNTYNTQYIENPLTRIS
jgi:hypothetical protein